jgi:hypothetical protein
MEKSTVKKVNIGFESAEEWESVFVTFMGSNDIYPTAVMHSGKSDKKDLKSGIYRVRIRRENPWKEAPLISFLALTLMELQHFWEGRYLPFAIDEEFTIEISNDINLFLWLDYDGMLNYRCNESRDWIPIGSVKIDRKALRWWKAGAIYQITLLAIMVLLIGGIASAIGKSIVLFGVALLVSIVVSVQMGKTVAQKSKFFKKFCDSESRQTE